MTKKIRRALPWMVALGWILIGAGLVVAAVSCTTEPTLETISADEVDDLSGC